MSREFYCYYSTQRPIEPGSFPKPPDNPPLEIVNYDADSRIPVEGEVFQAWGVLVYAKPLTDRQQYDYELRPSRNNQDVREKMERQAQVVGSWEEYHHIPEEKRVTEYDPNRGLYRPREGVTPERLNARHNTAQAIPAPKDKTTKRKNTPQHGARWEGISMDLIDAAKERFEAVEIFGIPGLFTTLRVSRATIPKGMYAYDMQTDETDWLQPHMLGPHITVDHYGAVLTASPIDLPENGYRNLSPGDFLKDDGSDQLTVAEFEDKYLSPATLSPHKSARLHSLR